MPRMPILGLEPRRRKIECQLMLPLAIPFLGSRGERANAELTDRGISRWTPRGFGTSAVIDWKRGGLRFNMKNHAPNGMEIKLLT